MTPFTGMLFALGLSLAGCATTPPAIRRAPPGDLQLVEARDNVSAHTGTVIRWGGIIVSVENAHDETWIEVLEYKLGRSGRPDRDSQSDGRFLIRESLFLDPVIYAKDREITVVGTLEGEVERSIGKQPYLFPVVSADEHHLWKADRRRYAYYPRHHFGFHSNFGYGRHHGIHVGHHRHHGLHGKFHH